MSAFITDLFNSIFTPGPTHSLLVATNVAFACLQLTLLLLLIATYSVHFLILSFLSAGLWWAINWFVVELRIAEAAEAEKKKREERERDRVEEDSETEAETVVGVKVGGRKGVGKSVSASKEVEVLEKKGELIDRGNLAVGAGASQSSGGSKSEHSTEDEWERVSENEKDK
ncbi:ER protein Pkr1-domain-containing protein [Halenospora varia]|nr:ER protein Pkr1-domain-containing protein [Halenospora varia]